MHGLKMAVAINKNGNIKYKRIAEYISLLKKLKMKIKYLSLFWSMMNESRCRKLIMDLSAWGPHRVGRL